jgi:hypothetical protein
MVFRADGMIPSTTKPPAIDNRLAIHENLVLTVVAADGLHLDPEFTTQASRHTDGMNARDSERAIANGDSSHLNTSTAGPNSYEH